MRIHLKEPMDGWASLKLFELAGGSAGGEDERLFGTTEPGKPKRAITAAAEQATPREPDDAPRPSRPPGVIPDGDCGPWIVYMHYDDAAGGASLSFKLTLKRKFVLGPCAKLTETCAQVGSALVSAPPCHLRYHIRARLPVTRRTRHQSPRRYSSRRSLPAILFGRP